MYRVGDKVFYPMHGAGIIEAIEEKEIMGEKQLYYIMNLSLGKINVMIPTNNTSKLNIRRVVDQKIMDNVLTSFSNNNDSVPSVPVNQRYRIHMDKMKTGDIYENVKVICQLSNSNKKKSLGTSDKALLNNAKKIFVSELILVHDLEQKEADDLLYSVMNK